MYLILEAINYYYYHGNRLYRVTVYGVTGLPSKMLEWMDGVDG